MTEPLFVVSTAVRGAHGPIRAALDARLAQLEGREWEPDLVIVVQTLADRLDSANGARDRRGYVQLSAEYRAARIDLFGTADDGGPDPLAAALAEFTAAAADHPTGRAAH